MKIGQLTEYNARNKILKNHAKNHAWRLVTDHFLFLEKALSK